MKAKVSVIIPVYNVEKYVLRCLDSIVNQTYSNVEIIVINDGSTDNSINVIKNKYGKNDKLKIFNKKNGGLSSARNIGLNQATGNYILFVDSDDWLEINCVSELIDEAKSGNADIIEFGYRTISDKGELNSIKFNNSVISSKEKILEEFFFGNQIVDIVCNKLYKKELFDNKRFLEGKIHEDYIITPELLYNCKKISIVDKIFYNYYQRSDSITQKAFSEKNFDRFFAGRHVAEFCKANIPQFYDISLVRIGFISIYLYNHLIDSSKMIKKIDFFKYEKRIISEYNDVYKEIVKSNSFKKLPIYKKIMFKLFRYNKRVTVKIYKLLRS